MIQRSALTARRWPWMVAAILVIVNLLWTGGLALSHDKALNDRLGYYLVAETMASRGEIATTAKADPRVPDVDPPYAVGERPLYPLLVSLLFRLVGPSVQAANFVSALARALTLLPVFALALSLFDLRAALVAGLLYTFSPTWTGLGATSMTETTFAFFMYLMLWAFVASWQRPGRLLSFLAGFAFALATLTREEGLVLGLFLAGILLFRRRFMELALFLLMPVILVGSWRFYLWENFGSVLYTARPHFIIGHYEFYFALTLPGLRDYLVSVGGWSEAIKLRLFNDVAFLRNLMADGLILDIGQAGLFPVTFLVPLGVIGARLWHDLRARDERARLACLLTLGIILQGAAAIGFFGLPQGAGGEIRQLQVITPFLIVLAAAGLVQLWDWSGLGRGIVIVLAIQFLLFCGLYQLLLIDALVVAPPDNSADIQALRQVAPDLDPDAVLMSRKPDRAAQYTDHPAVILPLAGFRDLMTYAQAHHVTHLVVTLRELRTRPGLEEGLASVGKSVELLLKADNTQIFEVHDYQFLPAIEEGGPLDQEIDLAAPMPPPDWRALLQRATPSTLDQVRQTWQRWLGSTP